MLRRKAKKEIFVLRSFRVRALRAQQHLAKSRHLLFRNFSRVPPVPCSPPVKRFLREYFIIIIIIIITIIVLMYCIHTHTIAYYGVATTIVVVRVDYCLTNHAWYIQTVGGGYAHEQRDAPKKFKRNSNTFDSDPSIRSVCWA
jgi:hypothetical protein